MLIKQQIIVQYVLFKVSVLRGIYDLIYTEKVSSVYFREVSPWKERKLHYREYLAIRPGPGKHVCLSQVFALQGFLH